MNEKTTFWATCGLVVVILMIVAFGAGTSPNTTISSTRACNDKGKVMVKIHDAFNCVDPSILKDLK